MTLDPQNASDPKTANHHWYPFLRYIRECAANGKEVSVNDWLIEKGSVKDFAVEAAARREAKSQAEASAKAASALKGNTSEN